MSALLQAIQDATAEDLAQVDARIEALSAEIDGLRVLQKVLRAKLGHEPEPRVKKERPAKTDANRSTATEMLNRRRLAAQHLIRHGATPGNKLAQACGFDGLQVYTVCNHEWFTKTEQGYHITPEGRQAVG
jgi:hypothetical protein